MQNSRDKINVNDITDKEYGKMDKRIGWIDTARGILMILILLFHTEVYYAGEEIIPYGLYVANALMAFFFISGYLFYKENGGTAFSLKRKLRSILRGIVMPYFIFTTAMALPKAMAHGNFTSLTDVACNIATGHASWFVTALAVAETIFAAALYAAEKHGWRWLLPLLCTVAVIATFTTDSGIMLIWNANIALMALPYLYCGYAFHKYETLTCKYLNRTWLTVMAAVILVLKWYEWTEGMSMLVFPLDITSFPVFFTDTLLSAVLIVHMARMLPQHPLVMFTGRNSIVYYFLCGGVPLLVSAVMGRMGLAYSGNYIMVTVVFIIVYAAATVMTWAVCRYVPFVTGRKSTVKPLSSKVHGGV